MLLTLILPLYYIIGILYHIYNVILKYCTLAISSHAAVNCQLHLSLSQDANPATVPGATAWVTNNGVLVGLRFGEQQLNRTYLTPSQVR